MAVRTLEAIMRVSMAVLGSRPAVVCCRPPAVMDWRRRARVRCLAWTKPGQTAATKPALTSCTPHARRGAPLRGLRRPEPARSCRLRSAVRGGAMALAAWRARRIDGQSANPDARTMQAAPRRSIDHRGDHRGCAKTVRPGHADEPPAALPNGPDRTHGCGPWRRPRRRGSGPSARPRWYLVLLE